LSKDGHILCLADLHVGSHFGAWPIGFTLQGRSAILPTWQTWLTTQFNDMVANLPKLYAVIINGDLIDGENPTTRGKFTVSPDPADQAFAAIELLKTLRKITQHLFIVHGTPFHEGDSGQSLEHIGAELKADKWCDGKYCGQVLERSWYDKVINATHHMTSGFIYPLGGASRTFMHMAVAEVTRNANHADVILRAHNHHADMAQINGTWVIFQPGFCFTTPYAIKRLELYRATASNSLGAVLLTGNKFGITPTMIDIIPPKQTVLPL
jgi:hypothetical protein